MKRKICMVLCLLLSVLLLFTMAACQENNDTDTPTVPSTSSSVPEPSKPWMPENATALYNKVKAAMHAVTSMESVGELNMVYYYMGYKYTMVSTSTDVVTESAYYNQSETKVACDEFSVEQNVTAISAYYDGKMYISHNDGIREQKLCSAATMEQFLETQMSSLTDEIDISQCTVGTFEKNGDEGWSLEFSGYTKKLIGSVLDLLELDDDMLGADIEDMKISIETDTEFLVKTMTISFVFEEEEGAEVPEFSMTASYSKLNTAAFDPTVLKQEEYVQVDDLFILYDISDGIKEWQDASTGNFVLDIKNTTRYYGQSHTSKETDIVTYGKKNNAYYYSIVADTSGTEMQLVYQNGVQTVTANGESYTSYITDADAKATVDGLIDSGMFDALSVTCIEKEGEGVYLLTCENLDMDAFSARVSEGITLNSGEQAIKVTFKEGKLVKIESLISLAGKYNYNDIEMDLKTVVDFEKEAEYPTI